MIFIMIIIYIGTIMFSKFAGPMNTIFSNQMKLITIEKKKLRMEENLSIFVIDNNSDKLKKEINRWDLHEFN